MAKECSHRHRTRKRIIISRRLCALARATVFLLFTSAVGVEAGETRLDRFLDGLDTLSAGFEQTLLSEFDEELEASSGNVYIQRPGRFQWTYREPYSQLIISDGATLWIYDEDLEQVTIKDAVHSIDDSPAAILGGDVRIDEHYVVLELGETDGVAWLELTPRNIDSEYSSVRLGFRENELAGMILFDNLGQKTQITFQDVRRNRRLDDGLFEFQPPEGVDVIDSRQPGSAP